MPRIAIIDFEASALAADAAVIEVGIAIYDGQETLGIWSSLVTLPDRRCQWDEKSEAVHKISMVELAGAPTPCWVASELNRLMHGVSIAYCDGYRYDAVWMGNLFHDAVITLAFDMKPWNEMPRAHLRIVRMHINEFLRSAPVPHRAGPDALRLMQAYCYAIGKNPAVVPLS